MNTHETEATKLDAPGPGTGHGPDGRGALPTEHLAPRGKIAHAIADVFEVPSAIVASAVTLVRRTRRVPKIHCTKRR